MITGISCKTCRAFTNRRPFIDPWYIFDLCPVSSPIDVCMVVKVTEGLHFR